MVDNSRKLIEIEGFMYIPPTKLSTLCSQSHKLVNFYPYLIIVDMEHELYQLVALRNS